MSYGLSQHELWKMSFKYNTNQDINVNNTKQLTSVSKSCCIELTDITSDKAYDSKLNNHLKKILVSWQSKTLKTQVQKSENTVSVNSFGSIIVDENHGYKIVGLDNPGNFCYMNSIIQVFVCLLLHSGCTYSHLVTTQRFFPNALLNYRLKDGYKLHYRKRNLKILRSWFTKGSNAIPLLDGSQQQDVHEAFLKIVEILHDGTKQCLIPDLPPNLQDDSTMTSFPRFLFRFLVEKTIVCQHHNCKQTSIIQEIQDELRLAIDNHCNIESMAASYWSSNIEKTCIKCNKYGDHLEKIKILSYPKVLRLVLLRFGNSLQKIDKQIKIDPALNIFGIQYQLTGIINHHGNSIRNGHYTATVRYKSWWHVNDNNVNPAPSNCFQNNSTAYLAFYRQ
jgi:ubiquitin C-terminal hydrolase